MTSTQQPTQQPMQQPLEIRRTEEIDLDIDAVWELVSTAQGWSAWLVDDAIVDIAPGGAGVTRDGDRDRVVRVDSVSDRHRVTFSWWDREDPDSASTVELHVLELDAQRSRIEVTERFVGDARGTVRASSRAAGLRWEAKLLLLCLLTMPALSKA